MKHQDPESQDPEAAGKQAGAAPRLPEGFYDFTFTARIIKTCSNCPWQDDSESIMSPDMRCTHPRAQRTTPVQQSGKSSESGPPPSSCPLRRCAELLVVE